MGVGGFKDCKDQRNRIPDAQTPKVGQSGRIVMSLRSLRIGRIGGVLKGNYDGLEKGCACLYSNSKELNFQAQSVGYSLPFAAI